MKGHNSAKAMQNWQSSHLFCCK